MIGCFDVITHWKKIFDPKTKKDQFTRIVLPVLCKWRTREIRTATESGAIAKRYATVVIPDSNDYTFDGKIGDYVALGQHETEITGEKPYTVTDIKKLLGPNFMQIEYVKDLTNSPIGRRHKIEGVV